MTGKQSYLHSVTGNTPRGARPNTSGYAGVSHHKATGKWIAQVTLVGPDGKRIRKHVPGTYGSPEAAHAARVAFISACGVAAVDDKVSVGRNVQAEAATAREAFIATLKAKVAARCEVA
ncbi:AP2/ERF family transcription factor [Paraburkholderia denitrificans]|uniref:AP2/ERF family transcription factor n=1 Tax=Paraburkholderia denitrificans TaxID=694025 RepID=A0ABW0J3L8_9BURK